MVKYHVDVFSLTRPDKPPLPIAHTIAPYSTTHLPARVASLVELPRFISHTFVLAAERICRLWQ
jgi:hypothetical protein